MGIAAPLHALGPSPDRGDELLPLLAAIGAGDERSFERLYDLTSNRIFALVLRILGDRGAAEEATLDVYLQVWRQGERYEPAKGTPLGWLLTIARTRSLDARRTRMRRAGREEPFESALLVPDAGASPEDRSAGEQEAARVRRALATLTAGQREALVAAYFGGLSQTEIAKATGQPLGTVKTRMRSGLIRLQHELAAHGDVA
ncbi:MAG TPA: sigma-70 family RNA polymerase sigma factor [Candidatus Polarisedimenticolaceae bacterium]|nr:sigma-70 family RNA polymerase sigma factor [Candidatus Polarisedimenticolaceae bacterium]